MGPVVKTVYGLVRGGTSRAKDGFVYQSFFKIPYAEPPIGNLRFALPKPPSKVCDFAYHCTILILGFRISGPWTETLDCSKKITSSSLQVLLFNPESKYGTFSNAFKSYPPQAS